MGDVGKCLANIACLQYPKGFLHNSYIIGTVLSSEMGPAEISSFDRSLLKEVSTKAF